MSVNNDRPTLDMVASLCKRRGFIFQSSEIYGGFAATYDYGPLGVELKQNFKTLWWDTMVRAREDVVGMDGAIFMHPDIWVASGHVASFHDPLVECKTCGQRFRADQLDTTPCPKKPSKMVSACGGELGPPRQFNLMFKTQYGPVEDHASIAYLRPETAQAIYVNFKNIQQSMRMRLPFGIAQMGKAFRNEIVTKAYTFRSREFEQMEMQFFVPPDEDEKWFEYWLDFRWKFYDLLGVKRSRLRQAPHGPHELAHYAKAAVDLQYEFPFGWQELEGIHNRNDYDLTQHQKHSGKDLTYRDEATGATYLPKIIETSAGVDRGVLMALCDAYEELPEEGDEHKREMRTVLRFAPVLAPIQVAVFPLSKKDELISVSKPLEETLRKAGYRTQHDVTGSIGKRYRRQDEVGTPLCITVDFDTLTDQAVTLRHRDTMEQKRVNLSQTVEAVKETLTTF